MKQLLITIAAVVLVGCGPSVPDISIHEAARGGNIEAVKQHLAAGTDVNAKDRLRFTPLHGTSIKEIAELLIANGANVNAKDKNDWTPLHWAARGGHKEKTELLIAAGADVNAKNNSGETALHWAAAHKQKEIVELLIANGADVNAKDNFGGSPLHGATDVGGKETAELLISKGADVNAKDNSGGTPLHDATDVGEKETAELLIEKGADVNAKGDELGGTPLHIAAYWGHKEIAELLIINGADINAKDTEGESPLHLAANEGYNEIVELLITDGAAINAKNDDGDTPLDIADNMEILILIRKHGGGTGAELKAIDRKKTEELEAINLLRKHEAKGGEELKAKGNPPAKAPDISIHQAAGKGNIAAVKQHLATGTDVNARNDYGYTPLDVAMVQKNTEITDLIRGHGGKSGAADSINVAALTGNIEAVKQHLAAGTDVNWTDENGGTLLHYVAIPDHKGIAELLIARGADVNAKVVSGPNQGETPLDQAITFKRSEIADLLRKHGGKTAEELKAEGK